MLGGIDNGLFFQSLGGLIALGLIIIVMRWAFSKNPKLIVTPIKAGKNDQYGLLKALPTPSNYIEAQMALQKLIDLDVRATLTQTLEGPSIMVFEKDYGVALAILKAK